MASAQVTALYNATLEVARRKLRREPITRRRFAVAAMTALKKMTPLLTLSAVSFSAGTVLAAACVADDSLLGPPPDVATRAAAAGLPLPASERTTSAVTKVVPQLQRNHVILFGGPPAAPEPPNPYPAVFTAIQKRDYQAYIEALPEDRSARDKLVRGAGAYDPLAHAVTRAAIDIARDLIARGTPVRDSGPPTFEGKRSYVARAIEAWRTVHHVGEMNPHARVPHADADYYAITKLLLERGADPNALFRSQSALDMLPGAEDSPAAVQLAKLLFSHGGTLEPSDGSVFHMSPLSTAISNNRVELAHAMLSYGKPSPKLIDEAFFFSIRSTQKTLAIELLDLGANPNLSSEGYGYWSQGPMIGRAVFPAIVDRELAKAFIRHNVNPNVVLGQGTTPLMMVVHDQELMKGFLNLGANPDAQDVNGDTALHWAVRVPTANMVRRGAEGLGFGERLSDPDSRRRSVELLLAYHANPNVKNKRGYAPLMLTSFADDRTIDILLHAGAEVYPDAPDMTGTKREFTGPVTWALAHWNETLATAVVQRKRPLDDRDCAAIYFSAVTDARSTLLALLDRGAQKNYIRDRSGMTPLIAAASRGNLESVRLLLDRGVAKVDEEATPPMAPDVILRMGAYYRQLGCNPNLTALKAAEAGGHKQVVRLLIDRGADPDRECN